MIVFTPFALSMSKGLPYQSGFAKLSPNGTFTAAAPKSRLPAHAQNLGRVQSSSA